MSTPNENQERLGKKRSKHCRYSRQNRAISRDERIKIQGEMKIRKGYFVGIMKILIGEANFAGSSIAIWIWVV